MALDLIEAVIAQLESNSAVMTAFDSDWNQAAQTGTPKFFADLAEQVSSPWCVITEAGESYDFMTHTAGNVVNFTSPGQLIFSIFAGSRFQARQLGFVLAKCLNDAPLAWPLEELMVFRMSRSNFNPQSQTGPDIPIIFNRVFAFDYMYSGSL